MSDCDFENKILLQPYHHITQMGPEKRNAAVIMWQAFNYWFKCAKDKQRKIGKILDTLYSICLIMDDTIDNSQRRRGIPTAHLIYGFPRTIISIIYATTLTFTKFLEFDKIDRITDNFIRTGLHLFLCQGIELSLINNKNCPSEDQFEEITSGKVGSPFIFALQLLELFSTENTPKLNPSIPQKIGLFFQVYNDYISLRSSKYSEFKVYCEDITEGRFSFPIIHAIQSRCNDKRVLEIMKQRASDYNTKLYFVQLLEEFGSFEYTRKKLEELKNETLKEIKRIGLRDNEFVVRIFDEALNSLETEIYCE